MRECVLMLLCACAACLLMLGTGLYLETRLYGPPQQLVSVEQPDSEATQADFTRCVRINPGPLVAPKRQIRGSAPLSELT